MRKRFITTCIGPSGRCVPGSNKLAARMSEHSGHRVPSHVQRDMTDSTRLDALRGRVFTGEHPVDSPDGLDADTLAALAGGSLEAAARVSAIQRVASCALCRPAVASVARSRRDGPTT